VGGRFGRILPRALNAGTKRANKPRWTRTGLAHTSRFQIRRIRITDLQLSLRQQLVSSGDWRYSEWGTVALAPYYFDANFGAVCL
jgi:hypothetical protein